MASDADAGASCQGGLKCTTETSSTDEGSCAVCGCQYAPCATKCGLCAWPRGVSTSAETRAKADQAQVRMRLQRIIASAKAHAGALELDSGKHNGTSDASEGAVSAIEDIVSLLLMRLENREQGTEGPASIAGSCGTSGMTSYPTTGITFDAVWEVDSHQCSICSAKLGRWRMNPRHHCRACGKNVCAKCSPSRVKIGGKQAQRVCTPCTENVFLPGISSCSVVRGMDASSILTV